MFLCHLMGANTDTVTVTEVIFETVKSFKSSMYKLLRVIVLPILTHPAGHCCTLVGLTDEENVALGVCFVGG